MDVNAAFLKYVQRPDAIARMADDLRGVENLYIIGGGRALSTFLPRFKLEAPLPTTEVLYQSNPCWKECRAFAQKAEKIQAQAIIGVGGGVALDVAKAVAEQANVPVILVPTVPATCSAATRLICLYDEEGKRSGGTWLSNPIHSVYVDEELLAGTPRRMLASGIADSLAKFSETASARLFTDNPPSVQWEEAASQAEHIVLQQFSYAQAALDGDTAALSRVLLANLYLTARHTELGMDRRIAEVAHCFSNAVTRIWPAQERSYMHGEYVGVGVLLEMRLTGEVQGINEKTLRIFLRDTLRCPTTLRDLNLALDNGRKAALIKDIAEHSGLLPGWIEKGLEAIE